MKTMTNLMVPMRDGIRLACTVYRPDDDAPYPAILMRTPYLKENIDGIYSNYQELAMSGYNMVFQDTRGTGKSEGFMDATGKDDADDGYDTIEWIAAQPWCDGNVGMHGLSYFGYTQMAAAEGRPPHLKALCPFQNSAIDPFSLTKAKTFDNYHLAWILDRVIQNLENWYPDPAQRESVRAQVEACRKNWNEESFKLPVIQHKGAHIPGIPQTKAFLELVDGAEDPEFLKKAHRPVKIEQINAPMFFLTGWFDGARDGTLDNWNHALQGEVPMNQKKLIIGPWVHGGELHTQIDGFDFGSENTGASRGICDTIKRWFDRWLKHVDNGIDREAPVSIFVLGRNEWREEQEWPLSRAVQTPFYFGKTEKGEGSLSPNVPDHQEMFTFTYDPENPFPSFRKDSRGHALFADPSEAANRPDVITFRSAPLDQEMEVTGEIKCVVYASTSAVDTDFACILSDVNEKGEAMPLLSGIRRGKFLEGETPKLLEPGKVYAWEISLGNISNVFKPGHCLRIDLTSSLYPAHNRNLNTAERIGYGTESVKADQCVYTGPAYPSTVILPIIP